MLGRFHQQAAPAVLGEAALAQGRPLPIFHRACDREVFGHRVPGDKLSVEAVDVLKNVERIPPARR